MDNRDLYQEEATRIGHLATTTTTLVAQCSEDASTISWLVIILAVVYLYQVGLAYRVDSTATTTRRMIRSLLFIPISIVTTINGFARVALFVYVLSRFINNNCNARPQAVRPESFQEPRPDSPAALELVTIHEAPASMEIRPPLIWFENETHHLSVTTSVDTQLPGI